MKSPHRSGLTDYLPPAILLISLILLWEVGARLDNLSSRILPPPLEIGQAIVETYPLLLPHIWQTTQEVAFGLVLALGVGLLLAAAIDFSPLVRRAVYPLLIASQTIPIIALAPLLVIWFGFGILPKIFIVTLFCFFPIAINTADGLSAADPEYLSLLRAMGANRYQIWRKVRLPAALPYFFSGLKIAVTYSVVAAIIGEWVGAQAGLGVYMIRSASAFKTAQVFATIVITSLMSLILVIAVFLIERKLLPWYHAEQREKQW